MEYDLLLKGGRVVDPGQGLDGVCVDVAIRDGRIVELAADIVRERARQVLEVAGHVVTPGLIDMHVHVNDGVGVYSIDPDPYCLARGSTTVVDAGSAGALTFAGFRKHVLQNCATQVYALLHVALPGLVTRSGELLDMRNTDFDQTVAAIEENRDVIRGVKVRVGHPQVGDIGLEVLTHAVRVAEAVELPLMVHVSQTSMAPETVLEELRPGDIVTHCFEFQAGERGFLLDENGHLRAAVREAVERGVLFDVAHGSGSFSFEVAERALNEGFKPTTISSDLHAFNVSGPVFNMPMTLSKFLLLGFSLGEVVELATTSPVRSLGLPDDLGTLRPGSQADVSVLRQEEGTFSFSDSLGQTRVGQIKLVPAIVVKRGRVFVDYRGRW